MYRHQGHVEEMSLHSSPGDLSVGLDDPILITGGAGFIGSRVIANLLARGHTNIRCFTRRSKQTNPLDSRSVHVFMGNLLSKADCNCAADGVRIIYHLAAGTGQKSFADAYLNSVVTTRNLLDAALSSGKLLRFVNVSSFAVYSNRHKEQRGLLDESCGLRQKPERWGDAYAYAKMKQDELVQEYGRRFGLSYALLRPGAVYGPGKRSITARVGIGTFGVFLHLGGSGRVPLTYVDNCADAIVLAGLKVKAHGEVFNVVDDNLPTSRQFLRLYKKNVKRFRSIYLPAFASYLLCYLWEKYSAYSDGQLPPNFNRGGWHAHWKRTRYSNQKLKDLLGWRPTVSTEEGLKLYFADCRQAEDSHA